MLPDAAKAFRASGCITHNDWRAVAPSVRPSKEASVAVISDPKRRAAFEPLYDIDPQSGASVEVFYADRALTNSFGRRTGWFWWTCQRGFLPGGLPTSPFDTCYAAYRDALGVATRPRLRGSALITRNDLLKHRPLEKSWRCRQPQP
jgi:hypothetical protein